MNIGLRYKMAIGLLTLHLHLPGCASLKEKRSRLKPLINRLHREFNISVAELDHMDDWQSTVVGCVMISNDTKHNHRCLMKIIQWIETNRPDVAVIDDQIELL